MLLCKQNCISLRKKNHMTDQLGAESRNRSFKLYFTTIEQNDALMGILPIRGNKSHVEFLSCNLGFPWMLVTLELNLQKSNCKYVGGQGGSLHVSKRGKMSFIFSSLYI